MTVQTKQKGGYVTATFIGTGVVYANNIVAADSANNDGETINGMNISEVLWSTSNGAYFTVARGGNTVAFYTNSGHHDYQSAGALIDALGGNPQSNVVVTKVNAGPAFLVMKLHKKSTEFSNRY